MLGARRLPPAEYVFDTPASEGRRSPIRRGASLGSSRRVGDRRSSEAVLPMVYPAGKRSANPPWGLGALSFAKRLGLRQSSAAFRLQERLESGRGLPQSRTLRAILAHNSLQRAHRMFTPAESDAVGANLSATAYYRFIYHVRTLALRKPLGHQLPRHT
jgi:hypothetical protein